MMKNKFWTLKDLNLAGKTVLVRVDFNVPIDDKGKITDDNRIRAALPTIKYLLEKNAKIILMSHLGRPKGIDEKLRMNAVAERLQELLKRTVTKLDECIGQSVEIVARGIHKKDILLLENLRFHPEEEKNSKTFAGALANLADVYVDDAFGSTHRSHASIDAITDCLPSCAGLHVEKELTMLKTIVERPKRPFVAIMGGSKVSDKIKLITNLLKKVDFLLIGGAMMFTFFKSQGHNVGKSFVENEMLTTAQKILENKKIVLPTDIVGDFSADKKAKPKICPVTSIPQNFIGLDIGPETIELFSNALKPAKTIFWNGPLGMCELPQFCTGSTKIARAIAAKRATKIAGGGNTAEVLDKLGITKKFTHVSTGGGATIEFLEQGTLPGIIALERSLMKFVQYKRRGAV